MPKRLLRGIIDFGDNRISEENLNVNYQRLSRSGFEWNNPDERKLFQFIKEYVQANHETPNAPIIRDFFERLNELTVTEKLLDVKAVEVYTRSHYETLLKDLLEEQNQNKVRKLLGVVEEISTKGLVVGTGKDKKTIRGVKEGLQYFNEKIYEMIPPETNARTEGDVLDDTGEAWEEYQIAKVNKGKVYGRFTGIEQIDVACHGIKKGEMWVHAAAPGGLKTTFAMNWAYNQVTRYNANVLYVSLEMKYDHLRRLACVMHTSNGAFLAQGYRPLDYRKVRDGELSLEEEAFYQMALKDLETNPKYNRFKVWAPDRDVTVQDIRVQAELIHRSMEIGMIIIDHGGLVAAAKSHKDYTIELNSVLRDTKKMALHFNGGEGIPVCVLFQVNRQGKESVDKLSGTDAEGKYSMSHLAYANEAERSADYITTSYINDDLKRQGAAVLCNPKNRDNDPFALTKVRVDFTCRRMMTWEAGDQLDMGHSELSQSDLELTM
jgi:replicative DNA helicase